MPGEPAVTEQVLTPTLFHPAAARRILRLALGTALCLFFSQAIAWPLSFIAPALTLMILGLPLPAPRFKQGIVFVIALLAPIVAGLALLPFLQSAPAVGILLVALGLFYSFYYTARGGSPVLGNFMTIGLTLVVTIGSVNSTVLTLLIKTLALNVVAGLAFVWIAHALLPDPPRAQNAGQGRPPVREQPDLAEARRSALRSLLIVLPIALVFMFISGSPAYTVVMIKVASLGQQATTDKSKQMGRSLIASTFWGGAAAVAAWYLLRAWPSLAFYTLLTALAALLFGRRIFQGPALHPQAQEWSYALLTLMVIIGPAVLDTPNSSGAGAAFWNRLFLFVVIALYSSAAVAVFDAFWPGKKRPVEQPG